MIVARLFRLASDFGRAKAHGFREPCKRPFLDLGFDDDVASEKPLGRSRKIVLLGTGVAGLELQSTDLLEQAENGRLGQLVEVGERGRAPPGRDIDAELRAQMIEEACFAATDRDGLQRARNRPAEQAARASSGSAQKAS